MPSLFGGVEVKEAEEKPTRVIPPAPETQGSKFGGVLVEEQKIEQARPGGGLVEDQTFLEKAEPATMWEKAKNLMRDPDKEGAKAVQALVDAEAFGVQPHQAYEYRDVIDRGVKINAQALSLESDWTDRVNQSWETGKKQNYIGEIGYKYITTGDPRFLEQMRNVSLPTAEETFISKSILEDSVRSAAKLMPMVIETGTESVGKGMEVGMGFGLITALLGQAGPQAALPEEIFTVPAATLAGFKIGATSGAFEASLRKEGGLALSEIINFKDEEGNEIDPNIARATAFGIGAINAGIEVSQLRLLVNTIPGMSKLFSEATMEVVAGKAVKDKLLALATKFAGTVAAETAQEVAQESTNIVFEELAKTVNNKAFGTDILSTDVETVLNRLEETMIESAQGFAVIALPGTVAKAGLVRGEAPGKPRKEVPIGDIGPEGAPVGTELDAIQEAIPEAVVIGTLEDEEGNVIGFTMADSTTGNTFEVDPNPNKEEVSAGLEKVKAEIDQGIDTTIDNLLNIDEAEIDAEIDRIVLEAETVVEDVAEEIGPRTQVFQEQVFSVVGEEKGQAITKLYDARAKAVGMATEELLEFHGLVVEKVDGAIEGDLSQEQVSQTEEIKASVTFTDTKTIIRAFETADVSSLVHELGHVFRRDLGGDELATVETWAGVKNGNWGELDKDGIAFREEKFARGWENYLATGQAPTAELQAIFKKFKKWMSEIYNSIKGSSIDVEITPEIKDVFDRLLTPAEEVAPLAQAAEKAKPIKTKIREATGQARGLEEKTVLERDALKFGLKKAAAAAKKAFSEGKKIEAEKQKTIMREKIAKLKEIQTAAIGKVLTEKQKVQRRRAMIRSIRDALGLNDNDLKKISKKDPRLMTDFEFKKFKDDLFLKATELAETKQAKLRLLQTIYDLRLGKVDNYRQALELPTFDKMTTQQLNEFTDIISEYQTGDVFLTKRELETVDRSDLRGIRTWREARASLAEEIGVSIEDLSKVKVGALDSFKWDTSLAEQNPFYNMLVNETTKSMMQAQIDFHEVETTVFELAKKSEKSRKRTLVERAIPQDKQIFEYLEAKEEDKEGLAAEMTPEQIDLANYIQEYFGQALDYLIQVQAIEKGRDNYFVHMRRTYLEDVKEDGLIKATMNIFRNYEQDQMVFEILDDDTGNILPLEKFFQFSLRRTGQLSPTTNIVRAFLGYSQALEKKKALDAIIPKLDIYAQSLTPQQYTPRGLEVDRSLKKFLNKYINNKKGRRISFDSVIKQGGKIDLVTNAMRTFTTLVDLGLNIPVGIASFFGEQVATLEMLGVPGYTAGVARGKTKKGKSILKKYEEFVGRSVWEEFSAPGKEITERLVSGMFGLFHQSSVTANKQFLLGSITKEEYDSGEISNKRLASLKLEMGRFRVVPGTESLIGSTSVGKAAKQYKSWAVPIMRTLTKDLNTFIQDARKKPVGEALTSREARELYRMVGITSTVLIVGGLAGASEGDDDFVSQTLRRIYRESLTLMQGISPALWLSTPRILVFLAKLGVNIEAIVKLEENKRNSELKGVVGLKKQLTPRIIKQITKE